MSTSEQSNLQQQAPYCHPSIWKTIDGIIHVAGVTREYLNHLKDLPIKAGDVFVDTYPKSGTTWVSEIVCQINADGRQDLTPLHKRVPFLEFWKLECNIETKEELDDLYLKHPFRIFKLHLAYDQVPMGDGGTTLKPKYIYVIRNPKDVAVSLYHHYKGFTLYEFDRSWNEFFEMYIDNKVFNGNWFDHVLGWWAHRDDPNILFLKYEDMKKDLPCAVQQIAKFLGKDLSPEMVQRIADQTTFSAMSDTKGRFFDDEMMEKEFRVPGSSKFIRKGEVGDWRNYFTQEQSRRFNELYEQKMAGSGLELEF